MGRPSTGIERPNIGAVRLTNAERGHLIAAYGNVTDGLRHLVRNDMAAPTKPTAPPGSARHRHTPGLVVEERWEAGVHQTRNVCADPECPTLLDWRNA